MPLNCLYLNYAWDVTLKQTRFELDLLIIHIFLSQLFNATDNLKATRATHWFLDLNKSFTELKSGNKNLPCNIFNNLTLYYLIILLLMQVRGWIVHDNFSLIQRNHILRIRSISHCVDISYIFLYLISRPFILLMRLKL